VRYNTVEIKPNSLTEKWVYGFSRDPQDRVRAKTVPNGLGFYVYPTTMSDQKAFDKLKAHLVARHKKEIDRLLKSLDKLEKLELKVKHVSQTPRRKRATANR
jgi:hypothetical protein